MGAMRRAWFLLLVVGGCSDDIGLPDARLPIDAAVPGNLKLSWTLGHDGTPLTCAQVNGTSVSVEMVKQGEFFGTVDSFGCASGTGTSRALSPGLYDVTVSLVGSGGTLDAPPRLTNLVVASGQVTDVTPPIAFDVDPTGTLTFRIDTGAGIDNCAAGPGGAGITATRIELRDAAGTCVPTTFQVGAGTYTSDCAGAVTTCIAADQDVTATMVAAGQHTLQLTGLVGAASCWRRTSSFVVRAGGLTTTLDSLTLIRDTVACP
jgi:hypothetical protein